MNICKNCGKQFYGPEPEKGYKSWCSVGCQSSWTFKRMCPEKRRENYLKRWTKKKYSCCICGFSRATDLCHIKWNKDGGKIKKDNITILCPNHHRLFDRNLLTTEELSRIKTVKQLSNL